MAFDQEAVKQLSQELHGGYNLSARLQELLGHPLDSRGQEEAMAISQELSRVFMVSQFMLKPDDSIVETDDSIGLRTPTKDKRISGEEVTPLGKGREEEVTRKEITPSPHKDGYQWRKYGQKTIQNRHFPRYYYKCAFSRDHRCRAKKQVQQQDSSSDPPTFLVTYVNEHTCQEQDIFEENVTTSSLPTAATGVQCPRNFWDSTRNGAFAIGGSVEENEAIVSCLATVINGDAPSSSSSWPPPAVEAGPSDPAVPYVRTGGNSPSLEVDFSNCPSFSPLELEAMDAAELISHCDVHMDVAWVMGTV